MRRFAVIAMALLTAPALAAPGPLPGTQLLEGDGDFAMEMVDGVGAYIDRLTESRRAERERHWHRDFSSPEAYTASVEPNREHLRTMLGIVEPRVAPRSEKVRGVKEGYALAQGPNFTAYYVRWQALAGVSGEGILLEPNDTVSKVPSSVIALPDCDVSPEVACGFAPGLPAERQFPRIIAERGVRVLVPVLIDRDDTFSGREGVHMTNQPHREYIYRAAFELGRHVIGYEIQKVQAAIDWLIEDTPNIGVIGYGEGGLLALYTGAVDTRVNATQVCGYFGPREALWSEPIYRNVFGLLNEFGDAEIASLIVPRALIVQDLGSPEIGGPPAAREGRSGAAPGVIAVPDVESWRNEIAKTMAQAEKLQAAPRVYSVSQIDDSLALLKLGLRVGDAVIEALPGTVNQSVKLTGTFADPKARMGRQVAELMAHIQDQLREAQYTRAKFWEKADATSVVTWEASTQQYRDYLWDEIIGRLPEPTMPLNPRVRQIYDEPTYTGYEVQIDVYEGVYAYGILLVPKDIPAGERRGVVVCQHGLEGRPQLLTQPGTDDHYYHRFAGRLTEKGYITFSPQNLYIGEDRFRLLQRKLNPLGLTLFSVITRQHQRILEWLATLPQVDPQRMGFYGLSYGGKTAMRVPALLTNYAFSICSGDFNEWIWKNASDRSPYSYLFNREYEIFEWNLGNTFNYAEMSWLICPRPFMVERGHQDGVAPDEWVGYEYARTRQRYDLLGIGDRTELEYFNGPHTIHAEGTFAFIDRWMNAPRPTNP